MQISAGRSGDRHSGYRLLMNKTVIVLPGGKWNTDGQVRRSWTLPLAYLNCQLSFESRVPTNGTPTHLDIAVSVDRSGV